MICPSCKKNVEMKRLNSEFWVIKCTNGECDELPEVMAHSKCMTLKLWNSVLILPELNL
jgi:ribosomal protein L37AE/L43A